MSDPAVYNDHREAADVGRRLKELEGPWKLAQQWKQARADLDASRGDSELAEMVAGYEADVARLEEELKLALAERDPADEKDVIVEIRGGEGGDEGKLWAGDLAQAPAALRGAARLQVGGDRGDAERRRRLEGGDVRDQGRRRVLGLQVRGRHASRPARARDRVAGTHPHVDRDGRGDAGGRGRRRRDRGERPEDRRLPLVGPRRPVGQHDRLRGAHHAPPDRDRRRDAGRALAAAEPGEGDARAARAHLRGRARAPGSRAGGGTQRAGRHRGPRREDPHRTTSRRAASPITA